MEIEELLFDTEWKLQGLAEDILATMGLSFFLVTRSELRHQLWYVDPSTVKYCAWNRGYAWAYNGQLSAYNPETNTFMVFCDHTGMGATISEAIENFMKSAEAMLKGHIASWERSNFDKQHVKT